MRFVLLSICGLLIAYASFGQGHDYNYIEKSRSQAPGFGTKIQYIDSIKDIEISTFQWTGRVDFSPVFSDKNGKFLFYYNNYHVYDSIGRVAVNGERIAVGFYQNFRFDNFPEDIGYGIAQNGAVIPITDSLFYLFHCSSEAWSGAPNWAIDIEECGVKLGAYSEGVYLTKVKLRSDGRIEIIPNEKKIQILSDTLNDSALTFVKHANGIDWWLLVPELYSDSTYLFRLYTETGELEALGKRHFSDQNNRVTSISTTRSSPDGTILARFFNLFRDCLEHKLELFHFDRCTGETERYFLDSLAVVPDEWSFSGDIVFSDNGRFLYVSISEYILQLDMELEDPFSDIDTVARWDGFRVFGIPTTLSQMWKLPNGKILIGALNSVHYLHYIHQPNEKGLACDFEQRAIELPLDSFNLPFNIKVTSLPTYPPYRMLPLDIDCEVNTKEIIGNTTFVSLYPNPAVDIVTVQIQGARVLDMHLYDVTGRWIQSSTTGQMDVRKLSTGVYVVEVMTNHGMFSRKLIVE